MKAQFQMMNMAPIGVKDDIFEDVDQEVFVNEKERDDVESPTEEEEEEEEESESEDLHEVNKKLEEIEKKNSGETLNSDPLLQKLHEVIFFPCFWHISYKSTKPTVAVPSPLKKNFFFLPAETPGNCKILYLKKNLKILNCNSAQYFAIQ